MISPEDVLKLVNAGFSKDEIGKMFSGSYEPQAPAAPIEPQEPAAPAAPAEPKPNLPEQEAPAEPSPEQSAIDKLTAEVTRLTAIVQKSNLLSAQQPEVKPITGEDIISQIIFPSYKQGNK